MWARHRHLGTQSNKRFEVFNHAAHSAHIVEDEQPGRCEVNLKVYIVYKDACSNYSLLHLHAAPGLEKTKDKMQWTLYERGM